MPQNLRNFVDICVIYRSDEDPGMWVAHSINTDQIALGKSILEAYVGLKRVIRALLEAAEDDPTVQVFNPAPKEVRARLRRSRPLPQELLERAGELVGRRRRGREPYGGRIRNLTAPVELDFPTT